MYQCNSLEWPGGENIEETLDTSSISHQDPPDIDQSNLTSTTSAGWDVVRPAGRNYNCDIDSRGLPNREQWGRIDGHPEEEPSTSEPRTPAPSETSGEDDQMEDDEEEDEPEVAAITQTAESLHITEPEVIHIHSPATAHRMATTTITEENLINEEERRIREEANAILLPIHPATGHRMDADEAAIFRAVGPDHPDPPPGRGSPGPARPRLICKTWAGPKRAEHSEHFLNTLNTSERSKL
ncbi:hypothetical protein EDB85DRAFT_1898580 [Lactarius pseudohatsudake]|nr:hypothetical protein EDB85DRAFT_1898580 [Lactarius pseudohatsudake]